MSSRDEGIAALKAGDLVRAGQLLQKAVQENPQDAQAYAYLGTVYGQKGHFAAAVECFRTAANLTPQSAPIRFNLAAALEKAGQNAAALSAYRETLKLDPNHQRAAQALARLEPPAPAVETPSAAAPARAPAPAAAPTPSALDEFAIGGSTPAVIAPPAAPAAPAYPGSPPATASPYGTPPPVAGAPSPLTAPAPGYGPPVAPPGPPMGPPGGMMPLGDWTPPPTPAPPAGPVPLGDWTPPPGAPAPAAGPAPWEPAAPSAAYAGGRAIAAGSTPVLSSVANQEEGLSKSALTGNCYLSGMAMGVWWGLIGAIVAFLSAMVSIKSSEMGAMMPRIIVMCLMVIAGGVLAYGVIGAIGSSTDDPEKVCGIFGFILGLATAGAMMPMLLGSLGFYSVGGLFGTTWVSWRMAVALGSSIGEQRASAFVVAGPGSVAVTMRR